MSLISSGFDEIVLKDLVTEGVKTACQRSNDVIFQNLSFGEAPYGVVYNLIFSVAEFKSKNPIKPHCVSVKMSRT